MRFGSRIDYNRIPEHVAIIMDGNGRWASRHLLTRAAGHKAGAEALRKLAPECDKLGIKYLTVYAFSTENWKRSDEEVSSLMDLLRSYIQQFIDDVKKNEMRIQVIGDKTRLDKDIQSKINNLEQLTQNKTGIRLIIALNYGGRDEIVRASKKMCRDVKMARLDIENISEDIFETYLDTNGIKDPELLIRTSGELRMSNFLIWQLAYSEFYFSDKLWPDFTIKDLTAAIKVYQERERRFGGR